MNFKPFKESSRDIIRANKTILLYSFLYLLILIGSNFVFSLIPIFGSICTIIMSVIFSLLLLGVSLQIVNGEAINIGAIFSKFGKFVKANLWYLLYSLPSIIGSVIATSCFMGMLAIGLASFLTAGDTTMRYSGTTLLILIVVGIAAFIFSFIWAIVIYFKYCFAMYVSVDEEASNISAKNCLVVSAEMMKGHKCDFFIFQLSFIGWYLLVGLTLGIMSIYVIPYVQIATANFYQALKDEYSNR